jgi:hypothetical protein
LTNVTKKRGSYFCDIYQFYGGIYTGYLQCVQQIILNYTLGAEQKREPPTYVGDSLSSSGALSTAVEPLSRHLVAAVSALQAKKRRNFRAFQALFVRLL